MVKKIIWAIVIVVVLLVAAYLVILRFAPRAIPTDTPVIGKLTCPYPVGIAGDSMAPALQAGTRLTFDRCSGGDKSNLSEGTIIAFEESGTVRISRVVEKTFNGENVIYKTAQDARPDTFIHVPASDIIAVYEK